jgi:hypothetical protein
MALIDLLAKRVPIRLPVNMIIRNKLKKLKSSNFSKMQKKKKAQIFKKDQKAQIFQKSVFEIKFSKKGKIFQKAKKIQKSLNFPKN